MKEPIVKLYGFFALLFAVLVGFTSYWSVFDAEDLRADSLNKRDELQEQRIPRGTILTRDDEVIARSRKRPNGTYRRQYPMGDLFGHPIGYSFAEFNSTGIEAEYNDELTGRKSELVSVLDSLLGNNRVGEDLKTTLDRDVQQTATDALRASPTGRGAVVALDVKTGAVRAMVSLPTYDPNNLDKPGVFSRLSTDDENSPLFQRATQNGYPPGSTFKTVTASAAIDSGDYTPESTVDGASGIEISGFPLNNFGGQDYGTVSLTTALTNSINTVWAQVAEALGKDVMKTYMDRFGFNARPPIDLPEDQLLRSGARNDNQNLIQPTSDQVDIGRLAIGQDRLLATPLQMAEVAQTLGNGGVRMQPYIVDAAFDDDGRRTFKHDPEEAERVVSQDSAAQMRTMMLDVVNEGTGTAAAVSGVEVAGKTGTAEVNTALGLDMLWFIGFTEDNAVAVVVENVQGGQGGTVAAPIAKAVLEALGD